VGAIALAISAIPASATQYTTTCSSGQYDMLSLMFMQQSYLSDNYYLQGTGYTWDSSTNSWESNGKVLHNDVPQVSTYSGQAWDTGKINSVKDFQYEPGYSAPPYWGYPWDINLFDTSYVYLWITEYSGAAEWWSDPYAYKAFNNGSTNNTMRFTRRCVVPGDDGTTSQLVNSPSGTYATQFFFVPKDGDSPQYNTNDCNSSSSSNLDYAIMTVGAVQSNSYTLYNTLDNNSPITLSIVPVTYQWDCTSASGNCATEETYEFGFDSSGNHYGLVQWTSYSSPNHNSDYTTPNSKSVFNQLSQWTSTQLSEGEGGTTVSFGCSSNPL
jgi:hypothetical protein